MTDLLQNGADATTVILGLIALASTVTATIGITALIFKKNWRLFRNLGRPLAIIPSVNDDMSAEARLLEDTGFFKRLETLSPNGRSVDNITKAHRLVVLRYDKDSGFFWKTYDSLRSKRIPVIIYAKPGEIDPKTDHMARIQEYSYHTLCNTPTRLLSDVWAIMGTYPEAQS